MLRDTLHKQSSCFETNVHFVQISANSLVANLDQRRSESTVISSDDANCTLKFTRSFPPQFTRAASSVGKRRRGEGWIS